MDSWPYNYHAHTRYGDGHSNAADYAREAVERGMKCIGISEHAPLDEDWTIGVELLPVYRSEVLKLKQQYAGQVEVLCGLECDWWPSRNHWWEQIRSQDWDYLIGSVHFVSTNMGDWSVDDTPDRFEEGVKSAFGGDMRSACAAFFACECDAAASGRFQVLGHFDLVKKFNKGRRYFNSNESWYRKMALSVVQAAAQSGIIVEVNTAGLDRPVMEQYPAPWLVEACVRQNVRLTLSSDAHSALEIQRHFSIVLPQLANLGVKELWRWEDGMWGPVPIGSS